MYKLFEFFQNSYPNSNDLVYKDRKASIFVFSRAILQIKRQNMSNAVIVLYVIVHFYSGRIVDYNRFQAIFIEKVSLKTLPFNWISIHARYFLKRRQGFQYPSFQPTLECLINVPGNVKEGMYRGPGNFMT